jgi:hypothetical protein
VLRSLRKRKNFRQVESKVDADIRVLRDDEVDQVDDTAINATRRGAFALIRAAQQPIR